MARRTHSCPGTADKDLVRGKRDQDGTGEPESILVGGEGDTADEEGKKVEADAQKVTIKGSHGYAC